MLYKNSAAAALLALSATTLFSSVSAQFPSSDTACTRTYRVVKGDTCDRIGQKTMTSTYQIMALNLPQSGPDCYNLEIGASLCLGRFGNDCQMVHRVEQGETCGSIARDYDISVKMLRQNNPTLDCDLVYDGLMLCTLNGLVRPPAPKGLKLHSAAPSVDATMPLGEAITAIAVNTTVVNAAAPVAANKHAKTDTSSKSDHFKHHAASHHKHSHHH